jgi:hypothetical protein
MMPHEKLYDVEPRDVELEVVPAGDYVLAV